MTFRTPREAFVGLRQSVTRALGCVTDAYIGTLPGNQTNSVTLALSRGDPTKLDAPSPLRCFVTIRAVAVQSDRMWAAYVSAYYYALDDEQHEIIAYHWHPAETPSVTFPHLHLEAGSGVRRHELTRAHLPTGDVPLTAFLRMAINDFGVSPRREDWHAILARSEQTMTAEVIDE